MTASCASYAHHLHRYRGLSYRIRALGMRHRAPTQRYRGLLQRIRACIPTLLALHIYMRRATSADNVIFHKRATNYRALLRKMTLSAEVTRRFLESSRVRKHIRVHIYVTHIFHMHRQFETLLLSGDFLWMRNRALRQRNTFEFTYMLYTYIRLHIYSSSHIYYTYFSDA